METKQWTTVDKSGWPRGEWHDEPDKMQWKDEATGLPCLIVRGPSGALCGYVGVAQGHPWHGIDYTKCPQGKSCPDRTEDHPYCDHSPESRIRVHGGITFADACRPASDEGVGICHVPEPGEPDHVWWFGFDCAHSGDVMPKHEADGYGSLFAGYFGSWYKPVFYVQGECARLAEQLAAVAVTTAA